MGSESTVIQDVSDTALWVAYYRSLEGARPDALFNDPLASVLIGDKGQKTAEDLRLISAHTQFNVLIRTVVIDRYIQDLVEQGTDCILNIGAGMDTRPYRLNLPKSLKWIEFDFPHIISHKENRLAKEKPSCQLQRISLDLTDRLKRKQLLKEIGNANHKVTILTEGVIPYLTEDSVQSLAEELLHEKAFGNWIVDYISPQVYKYLKMGKRAQKMKNAPFQFYPENWIGFFESRGWIPKTIRYLPEEGLKLGRKIPRPLVARLLGPFFSAETKKQFMRTSGYMILERKS